MVLIQRVALLIFLFLLSACAVMDLSTQDTAVPLSPKVFQATVYNGIGLDLETVANTGLDNYNDEEEGAGGWFSTGIKLAYSASPKADIVGLVYTSGYSWGAKLGVKYLLKQKGNHYLAMIPMATLVRGRDDEDVNDQYNYMEETEYFSLGLENKLLSSWVLGKAGTATIGGRVNISNYTKTEGGVDLGPYILIHGGVFGNMRFGSKSIFLIPEVGVEFVPIINGDFSLCPIISLGLGFAF